MRKVLITKYIQGFKLYSDYGFMQRKNIFSSNRIGRDMSLAAATLLKHLRTDIIYVDKLMRKWSIEIYLSTNTLKAKNDTNIIEQRRLQKQWKKFLALFQAQNEYKGKKMPWLFHSQLSNFDSGNIKRNVYIPCYQERHKKK